MRFFTTFKFPISGFHCVKSIIVYQYYQHSYPCGLNETGLG